MSHQLYTNNYRKLKNTENRGNSLPWERAHQFIFKYSIIIPENMHMNNIMQTGQVLCGNIYVYACNSNQNEPMNLKNHKRGSWEYLEREKGREKHFYYNFKTKK